MICVTETNNIKYKLTYYQAVHVTDDLRLKDIEEYIITITITNANHIKPLNKSSK